MLTLRKPICVQSQLSARIRQMARCPGRAQEHAVWHLLVPECHWLSKHNGIDGPCAEVGGGGKSIRPGPDHGNVTIVHAPAPGICQSAVEGNITGARRVS